MAASVPSSRRSWPIMPGGLFATRRAIRRRGGLIAIGIAISLWLLGVVVKFLFSGSLGGAVSFVCMVMALPVMPVLGMPATGGGSRLLVAIALSGAMWWLLGQVVAARVTQRPIVGWREWTREFVVMGLGLWVGAAGGLLLGALLLGAF
jgi:hypothetical protein